jgi:shikimate kinase
VRAVFLVGFMGAGKSSVGRALSRRLKWIFEDLDDRIERAEGQTVAQIFRTEGEAAFRRAEQGELRNVLADLRSGPNRIVALGGGAFAQEKNTEWLKAAGVPTVFLDAPVKELWRRCRKQICDADAERPLLGNEAMFRSLYKSRRAFYLKASLRVTTGGRNVAAIAKEIAHALGLKVGRPEV